MSKKKMKNPVSKRILRDLTKEWRRYLMIFLMLVVTIGFVSGMYVANNSMMNTLDENISLMKREDGHFELSAKADDDLIKAAETGEMADIVGVFTERAYKEAEDEIRKAARENLEETVRENVRAAISDEVKKAVDGQLALFEAMGMPVSGEARSKAYDEALEAALSENFETAAKEAFETALDSDEYKNSVEDAIKDAKEEIDRTIAEEYDELAEKFSLDDESFEAVPVKIYDLFFKETDEKTSSGDSGRIRIYKERKEIDLYDILDGRAPQNENEIMIDRMHADNAGIKNGDTVYLGDTPFTVVGLAAFEDYSTLYESNTDTIFDALTFDVGMTTDGGFDRIKGNTHYNYAFEYPEKPSDEIREKEMSDNFLKSLITQTAVSENETEIKDYVPAYANHSITFAYNDMGSDKAMGGVLLYILTAVTAFIFAVTISAVLEKESAVIGTLRSLGYTKNELLRYYMSAPLIAVTAAAIVGNILGYTVLKDVVASMYYNSYSLPRFRTIWTPEAFVKTTVIPIILMILINLAVITKTLKLSPLRFLRGELKTVRRKKAAGLPPWKFFRRFGIRVFLQNIPNYLMLFFGISFVMLLLSMAVGMPVTLKYYQDSAADMMFAEYQVILNSSEDEDGNIITTQTDGAERFSMTSLLHRSDILDEEVTVYGAAENSTYIHLDDEFTSLPVDLTEPQVYISKAFAEKYNVKTGDVITLAEKFEDKDYRMKVYGIHDYSAAIAVFMTNKEFNAVFDRDEDDFGGYISDTEITDIPEEYIAKEITVEDMTKLSKQMDHSMGSYMIYFRYVCVIIAAIILYLLTKIIIEKNERSISMVKILGYRNTEIASLYILPTAIVVMISEIPAIAIGYFVMSVFWKAILMKLGGWFAFRMTADGFITEYVLVFLAYAVITLIDFGRIKRIPKSLALKNAE